MTRTTLTEAQCLRVAADYAGGVSIETSASSLGCSPRGLRKALQRYGIELRKGGNVDPAISRAISLLEGSADDLHGAPDAAAALREAASHARRARGLLLSAFAEQLADAIRTNR